MSRAWPGWRKRGGGACTLCSDAAHLWYLIGIMIWLVRSLILDKWGMNIEWIYSSFREKKNHVHANVIEADALKPKKHHNLTSLVTLFTYMLQNNSKWADERHQNKVYRLLRLFFLLWPRSCCFSRQFSVFAYLHLGACSQANAR